MVMRLLSIGLKSGFVLLSVGMGVLSVLWFGFAFCVFEKTGKDWKRVQLRWEYRKKMMEVFFSPMTKEEKDAARRTIMKWFRESLEELLQ